MNEEIFERLKNEFDRVEISFAEAARQIGEKSPARLRDIYHGKQRCPLEVLSQLSKIGIDYNYILTGTRLKESDYKSCCPSQDSADDSFVSDSNNSKITLRLRDELQRLGLSQAKAASAVGEKSPHRVKAVLSGRQKCPPDLLAEFTNLGVDTIYVLTGLRSAATASEAKIDAVLLVRIAEKLEQVAASAGKRWPVGELVKISLEIYGFLKEEENVSNDKVDRVIRLVVSR